MSPTLHALLVGIDAYPSSIPPLYGCLNDIAAFNVWLKGRAAGGAYQLAVHTLTDAQATREAVINGFRQLGQAGEGDVALFYYSGHGSQQCTPPEFWAIEPDHKNETLVLHDSRSPGSWDLADKELAVLIAGVAARGAHVVVILDSCHSGSGTRGDREPAAVRWISADERPRPPESYLFSPQALAQGPLRGTRDVRPSGWLVLPEGRHVLLAACRAEQTAKEYFADGQHWGAFSYFLRAALESANGPLAYRDLFKIAQAGVCTNIFDQNPQVEAIQSLDLDRPFLGGAIQPRPTAYTASVLDGVWQLDAGFVHGIPAVSETEVVSLALFTLETPAAELRQLEHAVAEAVVTRVRPDSCSIEIRSGQPNPQRTYRAVVIGLPLPRVGVCMAGDEAGLKAVRQVLSSSGPQGAASLYVGEDPAAPQLCLSARDGIYSLTRPGGEMPLTAHIAGYTAESARKVVQNLEHIARWLKTSELRNPVSQLLPSEAVKMTLLRDGQALDPAHLRVEYRQVGGKWQQPSYTVRIKNQSATTLFCALLGLWESFGIETLLSPAAVVRLEAGQEYEQVLYASIPDGLWQQGITTRQDILKLVVSTEEFDARLLAQGSLETPRQLRASRGLAARSPLNRLMNRLQTRESSSQPDDVYGDWQTFQVVMSVHRPLDTQPTPRGGELPLDLGAGVTLDPHPALVGRVRVGVVAPNGRDLGQLPLPNILRQDSGESQPYYFRRMRGPSENLLELKDVQDPTVVTPQAPLRLHVKDRLAPGEKILAFGFDGEFYLPVGVGRSEGETTCIDLYRLPPPVGVGRDLQGSIRILFQKFIAKPLGLPYPYPTLAAITLGPGGAQYEADPVTVRARVAQAQRITLYVHGFTGETRTMLPDPEHAPSGELILAFDYESIHTTVEKTARALKQRLAEVGLAAGHTREVRLVAHSLGGVVARWFIEREGGDKVVQKLVMLGSPNLGTPWPKIHQWATFGLGLALNGLSAVAWPFKALAWLLNLTEVVDNALDQIQPDADLLETLNASADPGRPYTLIAGNTAIIPQALESGADSRLARLLTRLGYGTASLAFLQKPNDTVVSVDSAYGVPAGRQPAPRTLAAACDHVTFFNSEAGLQALAEALESDS